MNLSNLKSEVLGASKSSTLLDRLASMPIPNLRDENFRFTSPPNLEAALTKISPQPEIAFEYPEVITDRLAVSSEAWNFDLAQEVSEGFAGLDFWQGDYLALWAETHAKNFSFIGSQENKPSWRRSLDFFSESGSSLFSRRIVHVGAGDTLNWVELQAGSSTVENGLVVAETQIVLEEGASLDWTQFQNWPKTIEHYSRYLIILKKDARMKYCAIHRGGRKGQNLYRTHSGSGAIIDFEAAIHIDGRRHFDCWVDNYHDAPAASTAVRVNSLASDQAKIVFNANLKISPKAPGTEAHQKSKSLLLSSQSSVEVMPKLEIAIDDVKVSHGASVSSLDENQLFYLRSRGFSEEAAKRLLLEAFLLPALEGLNSSAERTYWIDKLEISTTEELSIWK
ncbi:MAG: hypothetical protein COV44_00830 [Deltaproteobacteria bacterium CG11_big_fil_rev_8_21_14_0_20_45_16]|nr:MAG: hypothetical protein COV44_00830 [Deltaproteobacteria bacterium CG11_big_fil_rev_8_21_14_0_20_45_16]